MICDDLPGFDLIVPKMAARLMLALCPGAAR